MEKLDDTGWCFSQVKNAVTAARSLKDACSMLATTCDGVAAVGGVLLLQEETLTLLASAKAGTASESQLAQMQATVGSLHNSLSTMLELQKQARFNSQSLISAAALLEPADIHKVLEAATIMRNSAAHSHLLGLPDVALDAIARQAGRSARLVCRWLWQAYGPPFVRLKWDTPATVPATVQGFLSTWHWAHHLTWLSVDAKHALPARDFATIATHLPNLGHLACPWLQEPHPALQPPPALTALTALALQPVSFEGGQATQCSDSIMSAFAQLPALMPQLRTLTLRMRHHLLPDASFTAGMQQFGEHISHLLLDGTIWGNEWEPANYQAYKAGLEAASGSLNALSINAWQVKSGIYDSVTCLTNLTRLELWGRLPIQNGIVSGLPPCNRILSLHCLDFIDCYDLESDEDVAALAAWLVDGQAGSSLEQLFLPEVELCSGDTVASLLGACKGYTCLTSLQFRTVPEGYIHGQDPTSWPAAMVQLGNLRQLNVGMDVQELNSTADWGALTALTCLWLFLHDNEQRQEPVAAMVSEEALSRGLGRLKALEELSISMCLLGEDEEGIEAEVALLRQRLLTALSPLPRLKVLDLEHAVAFDEGRVTAEELAAFAAGCLRHSLKLVVLPEGYTDAELATVQRALPGVALRSAGLSASR